MKTTLSLAAAAALALGAAAWAEEEKGDLTGAWTVISGEKDGKPLPAEEIEGTTVRWERDAVIVRDKKSQQRHAATYALDKKRVPWGITMIAQTGPRKGEAVEGLVKKDGETLTLIYALPGGERPDAFTTRKNQLMFTMKNLRR
jgi:uncharacterized protein (TIGR03067 family)